jgi:hypothetical protein
MPLKLLCLIIVATAVAGCASKPAVQDNTPLNPTAVIERHVTNNGIKGYFPFETNDTEYVRANMRRDESTFKGTGTFSGYFVGSRSVVKIVRLDRKLVWMLNPDKEEYTECPLQGCPSAKVQPGKRQAPAQRQPEAQRESGCTMRIAKSSFTVTPTGKKQTINGFDTEEYQVSWVVTLRDKQARTTTSTLNIDVWTAQPTQAMRDALDMEAAYARAHANATADSFSKTPAIIPGDASRLIMSYLGGALQPGDRNAFLDAGKQMQKIKGHPILTKLAWDMAGNACAPKESEKNPESNGSGNMPTSKGGLASGLAGMFVEKKATDAANQAAGEPILSFTVEVKQLKVASQHDGLFEVTAGYKKVQPQ